MSQQSISLMDLSMLASGAVSVFRCVGADGAQASAAGQQVHGVSVEAAADGAMFRATVIGTCVVESGAAITVGALLACDAAGRVVPAASLTTGGYVLGEALEAASDAGEFIEVLVRPTPGLPAVLALLGTNVGGDLVPSVDVSLPTGTKLTAAAELTIQAPADHDLNLGCAPGTGNMVETLSTNDGSTKKSIVDSDGVEVASLDSDGVGRFVHIVGGYAAAATGAAPTQAQMVAAFGAGEDGQLDFFLDSTGAAEQLYLCGFSTAGGGWWQIALTAVGA